MKKVFRSRIDWWLAAILLGVVALALVSAWMTDSLSLLTIVVLLLILTTFRTVYVVKDNKLRVWVGLIPYASKEIGQVKSVHRTTSLLSSPALSIDRLRITFANGGILIISPKDREGFIAALLAINEHIITDETVAEQTVDEATTEEPAEASTIWDSLGWYLCALLFIAQFVYSYSVYDSLPERIATHFDLQGVPNGWMSRFWGIWGQIFINAGILLSLWALPRIPGLTITGTEDASEAEKRKAKKRMSRVVSYIAVFQQLVMVFMEYYIVSKN